MTSLGIYELDLSLAVSAAAKKAGNSSVVRSFIYHQNETEKLLSIRGNQSDKNIHILVYFHVGECRSLLQPSVRVRLRTEQKQDFSETPDSDAGGLAIQERMPTKYE